MIEASCMQSARRTSMCCLIHQDIPVCALYLDIGADLVDVNVHPAKSEVRFRQQREVYRFVMRAVNGALSGERTWQYPPICDDYRCPVHGTPRPFQADSFPQRNISLPLGSWTDFAEDKVDGTQSAKRPADLEEDAEVPPLGFALAQLGGAYVLAENKEGLIIVDMHASHERITYEKLKQEYEASSFTSQMLLVPVIIKVSSEEADAAVANSEVLSNLGFDVSLAGENVISIRSIPDILSKTNIEETHSGRNIRLDPTREFQSCRTHSERALGHNVLSQCYSS